MSPPSELHPEEMLDAARRGTLSASAQADLDAHLRRCPACRMQLALSADFADGERTAAPPQAEDTEMLARMVGMVTNGARTSPSRMPAAGRSLRRLAFAGLYLAIGSGVASAMWSLHERVWPKAPSSSPVVEPAKKEKLRRAPAAMVVAEPAPEMTPSLEPAPVPAIAKPAARAPARRVPAPVSDIDEQAPEANPSAEDSAPSSGALFALANQRRRQGDQVGALAQYQELQRRYPGSREALTSNVIVGQLLLDRGDPAAALLAFRAYVTALPTGTLAEESRWGTAQALLRLQRPEEERKAWEELLTRHPSSVHAPRARARLTELRDPSAP